MSSDGHTIDAVAEALGRLDTASAQAVEELGAMVSRVMTSCERPVARQLEQLVGLLLFAEVPLDAATMDLLGCALDGARQALAEDRAPTVRGQSCPRDAETVDALLGAIQEVEEGLDVADETLMEADRTGLGPTHVHTLFRVFHTIKGVAGILALREMERLAHATEALLDRARSGSLNLAASTVDVLLDATDTMRLLVSEVGRAVRDGTVFAPLPRLASMLEVLAEAARGDAATEARVPTPVSAPPASAGPGLGAGAAMGRQTIKLDLERIDRVVEMIGELVILESMLTRAPELKEVGPGTARTQLRQLSKISRDLQTVATRMRMVPASQVLQKMHRVARDTAKKAGKGVVLQLQGEDAEMDRTLVERLGEPLMHLLRNAIDHGIEAPDARVALGKPAHGTIVVRAYHEGSSVVVEVKDDGRGLDRERVFAEAVERGLVRETDPLSDEAVIQLVFAPGFSTAPVVGDVSGRGVGLDVVKRSVDALRGRIVVESAPGRGTTFKLVLPLALAIIDATLVAWGDERYVIPSLSIVESLRLVPGHLHTLGGFREFLRFRGEIVPVLRGSTLFGVPDVGAAGMLVVVEADGRLLALLVDDVLGQQQVVIKDLEGTLAADPAFVGAAIIADGQVALILDVNEVGRRGGQRLEAAALSSAA